MANRKVPNVGSRSSSSRRRGDSSSPDNWVELPITSSGHVLTSQPADLEWMTQNSESILPTTQSCRQELVGSSYTTTPWRGQTHSSGPSRIQNMPQPFVVPSPRELLAGMGSEQLFSDKEFGKDSQRLGGSGDLEETSAVQNIRVESTRERRRGVHSGGGEGTLHQRVQEDSSESETCIDNDVTDVTWHPRNEPASSGDKGDGVPLTQQGGSSGRARAKRGKSTRSASRKTSLEEHSGQTAGNQSSRRHSEVWEFFHLTEDICVAVCNLCQQRLRRGHGSHVGTTTLRSHMQRYHGVAWENRGKDVASQPDSSTSPSTSHTWGSSVSANGSSLSYPSPSVSAIAPDAPIQFRQQSLPETITKRHQYACAHPLGRKLTAHLAKLLVLQSLPFHVVDSAPFRDLMACAQPRWRVPSRHYFSKKAVPAMHTYVQQKVGQSLGLSVSATVHFSADIWSSTNGQGQYMSITGHWINIFPSQALQQPGQVTAMSPPRCNRGLSTHADSASTLSSPSHPSTVHLVPSSYHQCQARRCHAVLHLVSLGEHSHTGEELLCCMRQEITSWLFPRQLHIGTIVTNNRRNILLALHQGGLTHAPCMANVFNLVVTRFLKSFTDLKQLLTMSRKLCMHFSHSYHSRNTLLELQRKNAVPEHRLICDVPTRWNSSLHMLDRLYEQRTAIHDFLTQQSVSFTAHCNFKVSHWRMMRDVCRLLRPFEEATLLISRQDYSINDVIPMLHVLEGVLKDHIGEGTQTADDVYHGHLSPEQDEVSDEEHDEDTFVLSAEGTQEEHQLEDLEEEDDPNTLWQYSMDSGEDGRSDSLVRMARCLLACLRSDSRIIQIRQRDDYWLATLLDPRFRSKMTVFFPPAERDAKMSYYRQLLCSRLVTAYQYDAESSQKGQQGDNQDSLSTPMTASGGRSSSNSESRHLSLESLMSSFIQPPTEQSSQQLKHITVKQQVVAYLESPLSQDNLDPLEYWIGKLDVWPQLAEFAMSLLSCPASSVSSERVFNEAEAIIIPRRTRLSCQNAEILKFVKMNQAWFTEDFNTPVPDITD